jgi:class 3 adenylate cyclase/tetratricopeptide (TPR) repeat protein
MSEDLRLWLRRVGLEQHAEIFMANDIDIDVLPELSDEDLKELGLSLGHRRRILRMISELSDAAVQPPATGMARHGAGDDSVREAERRQLTVLFCDLVGSTELSHRHDPEDLRELIRNYQDAVTGAVVRHGGYVANFLGDGIIAYFGWPRADEDEAAQAVRAGLDAVIAVRELSLQARAGIASGTVVVGDLDAAGRRQIGAVAGETPNLAARLQALAEPDQVVIDALTRQLVGAGFVLDDLGPQSVKGIAEPVPAWRVLAERSVESRFDAHATRLTLLVGREHELALLLDRFDRAAAGEGQAVLLSGEAGIGKSRLVQTLHHRLASVPHARLRMQCSPFHSASELHPILRHLEHAAGFTRADTPAAQLDKLEALLRQGGDDIAEGIALLAPLLSLPTTDRYPPLELDREQRKARTLRALVDQFVGLACRSPVLLVLEDAHWIDPVTSDLVTDLLTRLAETRILALVTYRPEFHPDWTRHPQVTMLTLSRLSRSQTAEVVRAAGGAALSEEAVQRIGQRADGIPLFIEELTRSVVETGGSFGDSEIPETLQASLLARLDRLGAEAKEIAQIGAVIGREVNTELLSAVTEKPREALAPALDRLVASQIVLPVGSSQEGAYAFRHALIQDAAYSSLLTTRRRRYHAMIAQALETRFAELADSRPEMVAQHYAAAADTERAITYWRRAAERAWARFAYREPVAHLEQALQLARGLPESSKRDRQIVELLLLLAGALLRIYRPQETLDTFKEAAALATGHEYAAELARAAIGAAEAEVMMDRPERESAGLLEAALGALGEGEGALRCSVMSRLGQAVFTLGNFERGTMLMREATDLARRLGNDHALYDALICGRIATVGQPPLAREFAELRQIYDETVAVAERIGDPHSVGRALAQAVPTYLEMADIAGFETFVARLRELGQRGGVVTGQHYVALSASAVGKILHGEFATAERLAEQALDAAGEVHGEVANGVYGVQMFTIRREQGRLAEVAPVLRRFVDEHPRDAAWRPGLALIASDLGFTQPARKVFEDIAATGFELPFDAKRNLTLSYLAEVCIRLDDADRAKRLYELLLPYRDVAVVVPIATVCCGSNARYLGMLATTIGDWDAAEEHFVTAVEMDERLQAWPWLAHSKYEFALMLRARGRLRDQSRAADLLAAAAASAERLGMPGLHQKVRSLGN